MSLLAAHINDAGISVLSAERLLYREPGFALLDDDELTTGSKAFENARIKPRRIQQFFAENYCILGCRNHDAHFLTVHHSREWK